MKAIVWTKYGPPDVLQLRDFSGELFLGEDLMEIEV